MNKELFSMINGLTGNQLIDSLMIFTAEYLIIILILGLLLLMRKKSYQLIIITAMISGIAGLMINQLISLVYYHPRPFIDGFKTIIKHSNDSSFPSDHTTLSLSIALLITYFKKTRKTGITLIITALLIGFSRVYVGVHYPFDIIGSIITSIIASTITYSFRKQIKLMINKAKSFSKKPNR